MSTATDRLNKTMNDTIPMLEETARVIEVKDGLLMAETESRSACNHCSSDSCTTSVVAKLFGVRRNRLVMANSLNARPGDQVVLGIPDQLLSRASVTAYLLPLLIMLGVTALGELLGMHELLLSLLALGGLAVGFFTVRRLSRGSASQRYEPRLLRIVTPGNQRVEMPTLTRS
jgi:sigma-E factor negative regulatory protein RseC